MQIQIDKDKKELKSHGSYAFPFQISYEELANYERNAFLWHWHPEIELTLFLEGEMEYQINDRIYHVKKGEALFCNSNTLHTGHMIDSSNCCYASITFHPRLLAGFQGSILESKFVDAIVNNENISSIHLTEDVSWQQSIIQMMSHLYQYRQMNNVSEYAIEIQILLLQIWKLLYEQLSLGNKTVSSSQHKNIKRLKTILSYVNEHYQEPISLDDIATEINISKSECCRFFKKHMNQSLFDYILTYRIEKSLSLLTEADTSITEVASSVGFSNPCYFGKVFKEQMGCSPSQYRKNGKIS